MANVKFEIVFPGWDPTGIVNPIVTATLFRHRKHEKQRSSEADEIDSKDAVVDGVDPTKYKVDLDGPSIAQAKAAARKNRRFTVRFRLVGGPAGKRQVFRRICRMWPNL